MDESDLAAENPSYAKESFGQENVVAHGEAESVENEKKPDGIVRASEEDLDADKPFGEKDVVAYDLDEELNNKMMKLRELAKELDKEMKLVEEKNKVLVERMKALEQFEELMEQRKCLTGS